METGRILKTLTEFARGRQIAGTLFIAVTAVVVHPFPFMHSDLGDAT